MADGIALASESNPDVILDIATLTGAAMAALGLRTAALLGDEEIRDRVIAAGAAAGEAYWPMPLESYLRKSLESPVADIKNIWFSLRWRADCWPVPEGVRGRGHPLGSPGYCGPRVQRRGTPTASPRRKVPASVPLPW